MVSRSCSCARKPAPWHHRRVVRIVWPHGDGVIVDSLVVAGLEVPAELVRILETPAEMARIRRVGGSEDARVDPKVVEAVFGEPPDSNWMFHTPDGIIGQTEYWHKERDSLFSGWFGKDPYDLVATRSVLIGDLGHDRPFALDYRTEEPIVRFMTIDARWVVVAESASDLLSKLGIDTP